MDAKIKIVTLSSLFVMLMMFSLLYSNPTYADATCITYQNTGQTFCWDN